MLWHCQEFDLQLLSGPLVHVGTRRGAEKAGKRCTAGESLQGWRKDEGSKEGGEKVRTGRRKDAALSVLGFISVELHWVS